MREDLREAVAEALGVQVTAAAPCAGGDINDAWGLDLAGGGRAFVKSRDDPWPGEFQNEAAGLRWLGAGGARVPGVLAVGDEKAPFLALEWIDPGSLGPDGSEEFGRTLAAVHRSGAEAAGSRAPGAPEPLRTGGTPFDAHAGEDWAAHYAERRLRPLVAKTYERGAISESCLRAVESICERIGSLAGPPEPPARLHGDLWGGNVYAGADGAAWLIDPKAHGGNREADLAMLRLFGSPAGALGFAAYEEAHPLAEGWEERVALWQLQPLLVHALYFGGGYGAAAERAARRYA